MDKRIQIQKIRRIIETVALSVIFFYSSCLFSADSDYALLNEQSSGSPQTGSQQSTPPRLSGSGDEHPADLAVTPGKFDPTSELQVIDPFLEAVKQSPGLCLVLQRTDHDLHPKEPNKCQL